MYPSSFYSSPNPRRDSRWHHRDKSVPDNSPALATAGNRQHPPPSSSIHIHYELEFTAGIYSGCLVSWWQCSTLSAPAGSDGEGGGITSHKCTVDYAHTLWFSDFYTTGNLSVRVNHIKMTPSNKLRSLHSWHFDITKGKRETPTMLIPLSASRRIPQIRSFSHHSTFIGLL